MGLRFRKSIKILPGVKLNLGKKSAGVSIGTNGARYSVNSSGRKTSTVGIPGTGLSYVKSGGGGKKSGKSSKSGLPWRFIIAAAVLVFILIGGIAACTDSDKDQPTTTAAVETTAEPEEDTAAGAIAPAVTEEPTEAETDAETTEKATEKVTEKKTEKPTEAKTEKKTEKATEKKTAAPAAQKTYVLNNSSMKFHLPSCSSCARIKAENKGSYTGSRDDLIGKGYSPCGICHP